MKKFKTRWPSMFLGWFPEVDNLLFKHFKVVSIKIVVEYKETSVENRYEAFEYKRDSKREAIDDQT